MFTKRISKSRLHLVSSLRSDSSQSSSRSGRITKLEKNNPVDAGRIADTAIGPLVLRRRKTDQLGGKALVTLPPRSEKVVEIEFDEVERKIYVRNLSLLNSKQLTLTNLNL